LKINKSNIEPYIYLAPALLSIVFIYLFPLIEVIRGSFYNLRVWPGVFTGLKNYVVALTDDNFYLSLLHNIQLLLVIPIIVLVGLVISVILHEKVFGAVLYRSIFFIPFIVPVVALGIAFSFFFQFSGAFNQILDLVGLDMFIKDWLGQPKLALKIVAFVIIWREIGLSVVLFMARLGSVSISIVEASLIDGAGWFTRFWKIYVPELRDIIEFYIILSMITMLSQIFGFVFVITNGGPAKATWVSEYYIYERSFRYKDIGSGSVMAVVLIIITILLVALLNWIRGRTGGGTLEK
jgi:ABC-type sugar transport system permease subunit